MIGLLLISIVSLQHNVELAEDLCPISQLESNHGTNISHKRGVDTFDTAFGAVGLKPSTAYDTYMASPTLKAKWPHLVDRHLFMLRFHIDYEFYVACANTHWRKLARSRTKSRAVYAWRWGTTAESRASNIQIIFDSYVIKYFQLTKDCKWG